MNEAQDVTHNRELAMLSQEVCYAVNEMDIRIA